MVKDKQKMKEYQKVYQAEYRKKNKETLREKRNLYPRKNALTLEKIKDIKETSGCIICGNKDHRVLDFHHRDPKEKVKGICWMYIRGYSWEKIFPEIQKCDILCSNCHRIVEWEKHNDPPTLPSF